MSQFANYHLTYRLEDDPNEPPPHTNTLLGVSPEIESLSFRRERNSHRGISNLKRLRRLSVYSVNQDFLEEISELPILERLFVARLSATNADCLGRCRSLRHLVIKGATKISSLSWFSALPQLDSLLLEHFKQVTDLSALCAQPSLKAFGFEGDYWTTQRADTFRPIALLPQLEALFLRNCRPSSDGLAPLQHLKQLQYLRIAAFYPEADFLSLRRALPKLDCDWFQKIDRHGSIKAAINAPTDS